MVTALYFITFIAALMLTGINLFRNRNANTLYILMGLCLTVNCMGRYLLSVSDNIAAAVWSTKILYLGGCFVVPSILMVVVQLCGFSMPKLLIRLLMGFAAVIYGFVLTIGEYGLYYESMKLAYNEGMGFYYLIKEYGPVHFLYPTFMLVCFSLMILYIIFAIRKRKVLSLMTVTVMTTLSAVTICCYIIERLVGSSVEYFSLGFLAIAIAASILLDRMNMYDMTVNISNFVEREKNYGYIVFDKKKRYVNSNEVAREIFPEISGWRVDSPVKKDGSLAYTEIVGRLLNDSENISSERIAVGDRYFEIHIRELTMGSGNRVVGYIAEIIDETADQLCINTISSYNAKLEREVNQRTEDILRIKDQLVLGMSAMVESRDTSTGGHIRRTSDVVRIFSEKLMAENERFGLTDEFLRLVTRAAPMHDLGKIAVDDAVLRKQGKFTDEEYAKMKHHSEEGARIVHDILTGVESDDFVAIATNVAYYHHEKWNGCGYPKNLSGEQIPVEARIMALADVFDALVSKRCYKEAFTYDKAFSIIENDLGTHFDPILGRKFIECRSELEALYNSY